MSLQGSMTVERKCEQARVVERASTDRCRSSDQPRKKRRYGLRFSRLPWNIADAMTIDESVQSCADEACR